MDLGAGLDGLELYSFDFGWAGGLFLHKFGGAVFHFVVGGVDIVKEDALGFVAFGSYPVEAVSIRLWWALGDSNVGTVGRATNRLKNNLTPSGPN